MVKRRYLRDALPTRDMCTRLVHQEFSEHITYCGISCIQPPEWKAQHGLLVTCLGCIALDEILGPSWR